MKEMKHLYADGLSWPSHEVSHEEITDALSNSSTALPDQHPRPICYLRIKVLISEFLLCEFITAESEAVMLFPLWKQFPLCRGN